MHSAPHVVILAAGRGTRMRSSRAKVVQPVLFRPMIQHVLELAQGLPHRSISVVVGHAEDQVRQACAGYDVRYFRQDTQLGTAHAVRCAQPFLSTQEGDVLILSGDVVLLTPQTVTALLRRHADGAAACSFVTARVPDPTGYGRVIRGAGRFTDIREEVDCAPSERSIPEINGGIYCFGIRPLLEALSLIRNGNKQGEYYLPEALRLIASTGGRVEAVEAAEAQEVLGVNDFAELAAAERVMRARVNRSFMRQGVRLEDPDSTVIDPRCRFGRDVAIERGCQLVASELGDGVVVESGSRLIGSSVRSGAWIKQGSYLEGSVVGERCAVGPYAHLRPGTVLGEDVRIGNFVETKNAAIGAGTKATHLSYIGDAEIGKNVNIGCGFITCNYNGVEKQRTVIEDDAFIGSDSQAVAPVRVGAGSYVASGSTITEDVPPESLAISRGRQVTKAGYARKYKRPREPQAK